MRSPHPHPRPHPRPHIPGVQCCLVTGTWLSPRGSPSPPPILAGGGPLMALGLGRLGLVDDGGCRQPRPDGPGSALLGHAVVADDRVEAASGTGVLG